MKHIMSYPQRRAVFAVHYTKSISTLLTIWSTTVLKVGVLCVGCEAYKRTYGVAVRISAFKFFITKVPATICM